MLTDDVLLELGYRVEQDPARLSFTWHKEDHYLMQMRRGYWIMKDGETVGERKVFTVEDLAEGLGRYL